MGIQKPRRGQVPTDRYLVLGFRRPGAIRQRLSVMSSSWTCQGQLQLGNTHFLDQRGENKVVEFQKRSSLWVMGDSVPGA